MKLFWDKAEKQSIKNNVNGVLPNYPQGTVGVVKAKNIKKKPQLFKIVLVILILGLLGAGLLYVSLNRNNKNTETSVKQELALVAEYEQKNDIPKALSHAKKLLSYEPDNVEYKTLVASLLEKQNPDEAKVLYAKMLDDIKKIDNPDEDGKLISTYWVAAGLAEKAGQNNNAKKYYQKVIDVADKNDGYQLSLVKQSQEAMARLQ